MSGLYDEDGIDGPFERRMRAAMRDDARAMASRVKPCAQCGDPVPVGALLCSCCTKDNTRRFLESHPWLQGGKRP